MQRINLTMISRRSVLLSGAFTLAAPMVLRASEEITDITKMAPGDFAWHPERSPSGAVSVIASIPEQRVHVYRNGVRIGVSTCSTGRPGHATPTGVFTILQKDADHRSSTYNNAPMPNMNRLTWSGIAMHAGNLPGYPASHGCIRLPLEFSRLLFEVTHIGTPVIVAGSSSDPWELIHPGLVLAAFEENELQTAVNGLDERSHPTDWDNEQPYPITTALVTSADRRLIVLEDDQQVLEDEFTLLDEGPLGEHVLVLQQSAGGQFRWTGVTHHPDPEHPLVPEAAVLNRIQLSRVTAAHFSARMHAGLTLVVSDLPSTPDRRSDNDFVVMTVDHLEPPNPVVRP